MLSIACILPICNGIYFILSKGNFFRDIIQNSGMEKLPSYVYLIVGSILGVYGLVMSNSFQMDIPNTGKIMINPIMKIVLEL